MTYQVSRTRWSIDTGNGRVFDWVEHGVSVMFGLSTQEKRGAA